MFCFLDVVDITITCETTRDRIAMGVIRNHFCNAEIIVGLQ